MTPFEAFTRVLIALLRFVEPWIPPLAAFIRRQAQRDGARALESYLDGKPEAAQSYYRDALAWQPHDADLHASLGQICYDLDQTEEAEKHFRKALDYDYRNKRSLQGLAVLLQDRGELEHAMYLYLRYLELEPRDALACLNLGAVFHNLGDLDKAIEYYKRAEREAPENPLIAKNQALALLALGSFDDARTILQRARASNPTDADIENLLGDALDAQGDAAGAETAYRAAIQKNPNQAQPHFRLAALCVRLDRYKEAVEHAKQAAVLFRQDHNDLAAGEALWELGWIEYMLGDFERSMEASSEALKLNEYLIPVHFNLGLVLLHMGKPAEARREYEEGLDRLVQVADLKTHAIDDLHEALQRNPKLSGAAEILARLEERYAILSRGLSESAQESVTRAAQAIM